MTLEEFQTTVLAKAFPQGPPENLPDIATYVVSALIEIQRYIECARSRHDDVYPACATYWHCGTTQIAAPRGEILRVYTVQNRGTGLEWCNPVILSPVTLHELRRWQAKYQTHWRSAFFPPIAPGSSVALPLGFDVPNATSDSPSGRARSGVYALDRSARRLVVAPWIQSYEALVVEWQGLKRTWNPTDTVSDDPDFIRLVRLWVEVEHGMKWGCKDLDIRRMAYGEALKAMMATCNHELQLHGLPTTSEEVDRAFQAYSSGPVSVSEIQQAQEEPGTEALVLFVGDFGDGGATAALVGERMAAENPPPTDSGVSPGHGWVFTLGNNVYPPTLVADAYAPIIDWSVIGRLRVVLGNQDLDAGDFGVEQFAHVGSQPVNSSQHSRWYSQVVGPVEIFVLNSGYNSASEMVEPDGNWLGSPQSNQVRAAIARSTAIWKIVVLHHPPYSSGIVTTPGFNVLHWVSDLPVHAVLAAHSRNYERGHFRNRLHIIAGTGGVLLDAFADPVVAGSEVRLEEHGFLMLTADCDMMCLEFVDQDGFQLDEVCITEKEPPAVPPSQALVVYYGKLPGATGYTEVDILTLTAISKTSRQGNYAYADGPGYLIFAIPTVFGAPTDSGSGQGFRIGQLPAAMGRPDSDQGPVPGIAYGIWANGYGVELVTVNGVPFRVYRSAFEVNGSVVLGVN